MLVLPQQVKTPLFIPQMTTIYGWANYAWSRDLPGEHERDTVFSLGVQSGPHQPGFIPCSYDPQVDGVADEWLYAYWQLFQPLLDPCFIIDAFYGGYDPTGVTGSGPFSSTIYAIPDGTITWNRSTLTWNNQPALPSGLPSLTISNSDSGAQNPLGMGSVGVENVSVRNPVKFDLAGYGRPIIGLIAKPFTADGAQGSIYHFFDQLNISLLDRGRVPHRFLNVVSRSSRKKDTAYDNNATNTITFDVAHHFNADNPGINNFGNAELLSIKGVGVNYDNEVVLLKNIATAVIGVPDAKSVTYLNNAANPVDEATTPCHGQVEIWASGY